MDFASALETEPPRRSMSRWISNAHFRSERAGNADFKLESSLLLLLLLLLLFCS